MVIPGGEDVIVGSGTEVIGVLHCEKECTEHVGGIGLDGAKEPFFSLSDKC